MDSLTLNATTNANLSQYNAGWMCMQANFSTGMYYPCMNFKQIQGLNLELPPNALPPNSLSIFEFVVEDHMGMMMTNCSI